MNLGRSARRAVAAGGSTAAALAVAVALPAAAEELGFGWEGEITDARLVDGYEARGEQLRVPVTFEFSRPGVITDVVLLLEPVGVDNDCDQRSYIQPLDEGDGGEAPDVTGDTTVDPTTPDEAGDRADWTFAVDPGCNGVYDLRVSATADPSGPAASEESQPLVVDGLRVSLAPASPSSIEALPGADRKVTVRWSAPPAWEGDNAPSDALGYRVQRIGSDGTPVTIGETAIGQTTVVDDDLVGAPGGSYRYRVTAQRAGAAGAPVSSSAAEAVLTLPSPAPPATAPPATAGTGGVRVGGASRGGGSAAAPPTTEFDPGFQPELDYGDAELGAPDAVVPDDANLLEVVTEGAGGTGVLVPFAIALCLVVWAGHLRHLNRRASPPAT